MLEDLSLNKHLWHAKEINDCLEALQSSQDGLSNDEANHRRTIFGENKLSEVKAQSNLKRFLLQFNNILIYVLLASALVTFVLAHYLDTAVIVAVVLANAIIGFIQEGKAEKAMASLRQMLAPKAHVLRDQQRHHISSKELVPGDVIFLEAGDKVPADCRLLSCFGLTVQEAALTGESVPVEKHVKTVTENAPLGDRLSLVYSGTSVTSGQASAVVVAIGQFTELGKINRLLTEVVPLTTPLVQQMGIFAKWLTAVILGIASTLLVYGLFIQDYAFEYIFMAVVSLSVAAIPEGLPAILTITLAIGVQIMAKRNAIVRRLPAIETIGAVTVICTDKTGTLTRNEMLVASVLTDQHIFKISGEGYAPSGALSLNEEQINPAESALLQQIGRASYLCNDAAIKESNGAWDVLGDPMEGALLAFSGKVGLIVEKDSQRWRRTDAIPFDAQHRYMATLNHDHDGNAFIFIKGAPEKIMSMSSQQLSSSGEPQALDENYWKTKASEIASQGQRVLAFGIVKVDYHETLISRDELVGKVQLLGMVGMIDPPREEAIVAVAECRSAGIQVKMITGDHAGTALAIAKQVGLQHTEQALTGAEIDNMTDDMLKETISKVDVFARTSPEHKLRLVTALQANKELVAMTGDGVNDSPALKRADIGIAMGKKGSEAAKEAAEIVLADDNFASIVAAVKEGRTVYDNIRKVIFWLLPTNTGEAMIVIVALLLGLALPITPVQILWINLITAITLGFALAFEPSDSDIMKRAPRSNQAGLISGQLILHVLTVSVLIVMAVFSIYGVAISQNLGEPLARTLALNTLVVLEIFHLLYIRNASRPGFKVSMLKGTKVVWLTITLVLLAQIIVCYVPFFQSVFGTAALSAIQLFSILILGVIFYCILEVEKHFRFKLIFKNKVSE